MPLAIVYSRATAGISAPLVTVEVHLSKGMPYLSIVGLPETAVKESKDRVRSALLNTFFKFPTRRLTINLAPADLPKEGGRFDLPIALGILAASGQIPMEKLAEYEFAGELALSGELRPVQGVLPIVLAASQSKRNLIVPAQNATEAALVKQANVYYAHHILEVCAHLRGESKLALCEADISQQSGEVTSQDLSDVCGQSNAKRALEIAAAGKHSLLYIGPPGTGKTMLANRLPTILPPLTEEQSLEVAAIASAGLSGFDYKKWQQLPIRSPHHSSSNVALVGGGRPPRPGEISLAHHGVLFLDELPEFNRHVLESMREPMESGSITISRAAYQTIFPAQFQLIAAMNPCPCGYFGSTRIECQCTSEQVARYFGKISGPLLDRVDMHVEVPTVSPDILSPENQQAAEPSAQVRERVIYARERQLTRQAKSNKELSVQEVNLFCTLDEDSKNILHQVINKFNLSARVFHRIVKVARTIADLAGRELILRDDVAEALLYRCLDRTKKVI